jgi:hypothetical protein
VKECGLGGLVKFHSTRIKRFLNKTFTFIPLIDTNGKNNKEKLLAMVSKPDIRQGSNIINPITTGNNIVQQRDIN